MVRAIVTKNTKDKPRSFFDNIDKWSKEQGASGLAYFTIEKDKVFKAKGPVGKFFGEEAIKELMRISALLGTAFLWLCGKEHESRNYSVFSEPIAKDLSLKSMKIYLHFAGSWIVPNV